MQRQGVIMHGMHILGWELVVLAVVFVGGIATAAAADGRGRIGGLPIDELSLMTEDELLEEATSVCELAVGTLRPPWQDMELRAESLAYLVRIGRVYRAKAGRLPAWQAKLAAVIGSAKASDDVPGPEQCRAVQREYLPAGQPR